MAIVHRPRRVLLRAVRPCAEVEDIISSFPVYWLGQTSSVKCQVEVNIGEEKIAIDIIKTGGAAWSGAKAAGAV